MHQPHGGRKAQQLAVLHGKGLSKHPQQTLRCDARWGTVHPEQVTTDTGNHSILGKFRVQSVGHGFEHGITKMGIQHAVNVGKTI